MKYSWAGGSWTIGSFHLMTVWRKFNLFTPPDQPIDSSRVECILQIHIAAHWVPVWPITYFFFFFIDANAKAQFVRVVIINRWLNGQTSQHHQSIAIIINGLSSQRDERGNGEFAWSYALPIYIRISLRHWHTPDWMTELLRTLKSCKPWPPGLLTRAFQLPISNLASIANVLKSQGFRVLLGKSKASNGKSQPKWKWKTRHS